MGIMLCICTLKSETCFRSTVMHLSIFFPSSSPAAAIRCATSWPLICCGFKILSKFTGYTCHWSKNTSSKLQICVLLLYTVGVLVINSVKASFRSAFRPRVHGALAQQH